jgi:hypothetical protein
MLLVEKFTLLMPPKDSVPCWLDIVTDPYPQSMNQSPPRTGGTGESTTSYHLSVRAYVCLCARFPEGFPTKSVAFITIISVVLMLSSLYFIPLIIFSEQYELRRSSQYSSLSFPSPSWIHSPQRFLKTWNLPRRDRRYHSHTQKAKLQHISPDVFTLGTVRTKILNRMVNKTVKDVQCDVVERAVPRRSVLSKRHACLQGQMYFNLGSQ